MNAVSRASLVPRLLTWWCIIAGLVLLAHRTPLSWLPWSAWAPLFAGVLTAAVFTWRRAAPADDSARRLAVTAVLVAVMTAPILQLPPMPRLLLDLTVAVVGITLLVKLVKGQL